MRISGEDCPPDSRLEEKEFDGAHLDIGGSYQDDDSLSRIPLQWMWEEMKSAGLPMNPLPVEEGGALKIHKPYKNIKYLPTLFKVWVAHSKGKDPTRKTFYPSCPRTQ